MLAITRREGDSFTLSMPGYPHPIRLCVVRIRDSREGPKVMLGIDAPREVQVCRDNAINKSPPGAAPAGTVPRVGH